MITDYFKPIQSVENLKVIEATCIYHIHEIKNQLDKSELDETVISNLEDCAQRWEDKRREVRNQIIRITNCTTAMRQLSV